MFYMSRGATTPEQEIPADQTAPGSLWVGVAGSFYLTATDFDTEGDLWISDGQRWIRMTPSTTTEVVAYHALRASAWLACTKLFRGVTTIPRIEGEAWGDYARRVGHPPKTDRAQWLAELCALAGE